MNAVERFDRETERDIAAFVPAHRADEYRARRKASVARSFAQMTAAMESAAEGAQARGAEISRQINQSVERMRNSRP